VCSPCGARASESITRRAGVWFGSIAIASAIAMQMLTCKVRPRQEDEPSHRLLPLPPAPALLEGCARRARRWAPPLLVGEPLHCKAGWRLALERLPEVVVLPQPPSAEHAPPEGGISQFVAAFPAKLVEAVSPLGGIFTTLFEHVSSATLPEAMLGLAALLAKDLQELERSTAREPSSEHSELLKEALRYMRLSSAAYGPLILNPVMFPEKAVIPNSLDIITDPLAMICDHARLDRASVRVLHAKSSSGWLQPAHYVLHDVRRREAVVMVRGTLSVEDVVTDLGAEEVDFFLGGKAHRNILHSACNVLRSVAPVLEGLAGEVDSITFTGHSLGGGVAAYSAMLFSELLDTGRWFLPGGGPEVRCFSFGAPGLCSLEVSRSLRGRITSVCHAHDIVPRLSFGHVLELHDRAMAVAAGGRSVPEPKHKRGKLYPAGRCLLVLPDGALAELEPEALAPHISLAGRARLLSDHFPPRYEAAISAGLVRSVGAEA